MANRCMSSFETGAYAPEWTASTISGSAWSLAVDTTSVRPGAVGTYGLHITKTTATGAGTTGQAVLSNGFGGGSVDTLWFTDVASTGNVMLQFPIRYRFYVKVNTWGSSALKVDEILGFAVAIGGVGKEVGLTLSGSSRTLSIRDTTGGLTSVMNLSAATWYRLEGTLNETMMNCTVYLETGTTVQGQLSKAHPAGNLDISFGAVTVLFGAKALLDSNSSTANREYYFDDLFIRDARGTNTALIGQGTQNAPMFPNGDSATIEWNTTGSATHYQNVDDWTNTADYNETPTGAGTGNKKDILDFGAYPGANTVNGVAILHYTGDKPGVTPGNMYIGMHNSGSYATAPAFTSDLGVGAFFYRAIIPDGQPGASAPDQFNSTPTAWDNTSFGAAQVVYARYAGGGSDDNSSKRIASIYVITEDDLGATPPTTPTRQRNGPRWW